MEHALHLAAKHFVEAVGPTTGNCPHNSDEEDDGEEFEVADTIGKALALVTQVSLFLYLLFSADDVYVDSQVAPSMRLLPQML
jgi:hypothetical protein